MIKNQPIPPTYFNASNNVTSSSPITFNDNVIGIQYSAPLVSKFSSLTLDLESDMSFDGSLLQMTGIPLVSGDTYHITIDPITKRLAYQSQDNIDISVNSINLTGNGNIENFININGKENVDNIIKSRGTTGRLVLSSTNDISLNSSIIIDNSNILLNNTNTITLDGNYINIGNSNSVIDISGTETTIGSTLKLISFSGGGTTTATIDNNGIIIRTASDKRLKKEILKLYENKNVIENFERLNPVEYKWIDEEKYGSQLNFGFIANEVEKIYPNLVYKSFTDNDGNEYLGFSHDSIIPILTAVLQEKSKKIKVQEEEISQLKNRIISLEDRLQLIETKIGL